MEQSKTKKRGTFAAKIIVMVILAVIVSNVTLLAMRKVPTHMTMDTGSPAHSKRRG